MSIKKIINIDSRFRENFFYSDSNDFTIKLNYSLNHVVSIKLFNIQIPNVWYNISDYLGNNSFILGGTKYIIPDGNYNSSTLSQQIEIITLNNALLYDNSITDFLLSVNGVNGKTTFKSKDGNNFDLTFSSSTVKNDDFIHTFGWLIGFREMRYTGQNEYTSEGIFNVGGFNYFYLVVDDRNTHSSDLVVGNLKDSYIADNILALIRVNTTNFTVVNTDEYDTQMRIYSKPVRIRELSIKLLDPYGKLINLNNMDFSFGIEFEIKQ